jgi:esterase/lipase
MDEFIEIIKFLNVTYNFKVAIGHSIGAMALLKTVSNGLPLKKLVSIAATNHIDEIIAKFLIHDKLNPNLTNRFKSRYKQKYKSDLSNYNGIVCAKKIKIPTLIIHDSQDRSSAVSSAYEIRQNLEQGELLVTYDLGHTRILKSNLINNRIIEFIKDE